MPLTTIRKSGMCSGQAVHALSLSLSVSLSVFSLSLSPSLPLSLSVSVSVSLSLSSSHHVQMQNCRTRPGRPLRAAASSVARRHLLQSRPGKKEKGEQYRLPSSSAIALPMPRLHPHTLTQNQWVPRINVQRGQALLLSSTWRR